MSGALMSLAGFNDDSVCQQCVAYYSIKIKNISPNTSIDTNTQGNEYGTYLNMCYSEYWALPCIQTKIILGSRPSLYKKEHLQLYKFQLFQIGYKFTKRRDVTVMQENRFLLFYWMIDVFSLYVYNTV